MKAQVVMDCRTPFAEQAKQNKSKRKFTPLFTAMLLALYQGSALAEITLSGDTNPLSTGGADPWDLGGANFDIGLATNSGNGSLSINNGSQVTGVNWATLNGYPIYGSGSFISIHDPGSLFSANLLRLNSTSENTLSVENGGRLEVNQSFTVGYLSTSTGINNVTVDGTGSVVQAESITLRGASGSTDLNISNGAEVIASQAMHVNYAEVHLNNGSLSTGELWATPSSLLGTGTINTNGIVSDMDLVLDANNGLIQSHLLNDLPGQNINLNLDLSQANSATVGVGYFGNGSLRIADGVSLNTYRGKLGVHTGSNGQAIIEGAGSQWTTSFDMDVGASGSAELIIRNGGLGDFGNMDIRGAYRLDAPQEQASVLVENARLDIGSTLNIGPFSTDQATLTINDGGIVNVGRRTFMRGGSLLLNGGELNVADFTQYDGSYFGFIAGDMTVSDGDADFGSEILRIGNDTTNGRASSFTLTNGATAIVNNNLNLGQESQASMLIEGGSTLSTNGATIAIEGQADATITGAGSRWDVNGDFDLGYGRGVHATLNVLNGGVLNTGRASISDEGQVQSWAEAFVDGVGSQWNVSGDLDVGGGPVLGSGGSTYYDYGTLTVSNGAQVSATSTTRLGGVNSTLTIDGGTLTTGSFNNANGGTFNFYDGVLIVDGGSFVPGSNFELDSGSAAQTAEVVLRNGVMANSAPSEYIGRNHNGRLLIESGSSKTSQNLFLGDNASGNGFVRVAGVGSSLTAYSIEVGDFGTGRLEILDGATLDTTWLLAGYRGGSRGELLVSGVGTHLNASRFDYLGDYGSASMIVEQGATVTQSGTFFTLANRTGSSAQATVRSGATLNALGQFIIGSRGNAQLSIESGGVVNSTSSTWMASTGSNSSINVSGGGSQFNIGQDFFVGNNGGHANLQVANGGAINVGRSAYLSYTSQDQSNPAQTSLRVSGPGARFATTEHLQAGYASYADTSVVVENGGELAVGNVFNVATGYAAEVDMNVSGAGTQVSAAGYAYFGNSGGGRAHLQVTDGASFHANRLSFSGNGGTDIDVVVSGHGANLTSNTSFSLSGSRNTPSLTVANGGLIEAITGNLSFGENIGYGASIKFGIGDDGTGNIASGSMVGNGLYINAWSGTVFSLAVDNSAEALGGLNVGDSFTLIDYVTWDGDLFSVDDGQGGLIALVDGDTYTFGRYDFLIDYDALIGTDDYAFVATLAGVSAVPVPPAVWLFGTGLLAMFSLSRRHKRS